MAHIPFEHQYNNELKGDGWYHSIIPVGVRPGWEKAETFSLFVLLPMKAYILVAPLVCATAICPLMVFELLAKPVSSHKTYRPYHWDNTPPVHSATTALSVKVWTRNQAHTLTIRFALQCGINLISLTDLLLTSWQGWVNTKASSWLGYVASPLTS